ncbi:MAG: hypothetical protein AB7G15_11890 [Alphaproteobacteria bacterium]
MGAGGRESGGGIAAGLSAYSDLFGEDQFFEVERAYRAMVDRYGQVQTDYTIKQYIRQALLQRLAKR